MKTLSEYMEMSYRMEIVEDKEEGIEIREPIYKEAMIL